MFHLPGQPGFGMDLPEDGVHESIVNGAPKTVSDGETIELIQILCDGLHPILEREASAAAAG